MDPHEEAFLRAFVERRYRERCFAKGGLIRRDFWHRLPGRLVERRMFELPNNVHVPGRIIPVLRQLTRRTTARLLSADPDLDGTEIQLSELPDLEGTIVSIEAGELALYQTEHALPRSFHFLLVRDPELRRRVPGILAAASEKIRSSEGRSGR